MSGNPVLFDARARFARETDIYFDSPRLDAQRARASRMNIYIQMVYINSTQRKNGLDPGYIHPRAVDIRRKRSQILRVSRHNRITHNSRAPSSSPLCASSFLLALSTCDYVLNCIFHYKLFSLCLYPKTESY